MIYYNSGFTFVALGIGTIGYDDIVLTKVSAKILKRCNVQLKIGAARQQAMVRRSHRL